MSTSKRVFVLVGDEQTPLSPQDVAAAVTGSSFRAVSQRYGFSETTLRRFLLENGIVAKRSVVYGKAPSIHEAAAEAYLDASKVVAGGG